MSVDFNVNQIPYRFFGDKLISTDKSNNLIIESSSNNIELKSNTKNFIFNNNIIFNYGLNLNDIDLSNIRSITAKTLNTNTLFLRNKERSQTSIEDTESIENGYIRATTIGNTISGSSNAYFTYINVSGGDSSFNNSVYIKDKLTVNGTTSISNDLIVNGKSFVTLYNAINNYIVNNSQQLVSAKITTNDLSATNISISNDLVVVKTSFINDLTISGQMLNNVLKVPALFTIDPSGHGNPSGTLIINGDLMVYGNNTIIASSNIEISDVAISVATNLNNKNDLSGNSAGLDISNVASLKYNGTLWNFSGGQVSVENKRVALDVSFIEFRSFSEASLASLNSDIDLSFGQLKNNIDNSYNAIYSRRQIDNSFLLITTFDLSKQSFASSIDNSYVTKLAFDGSFSTLKTYLDASYIIKSTSTNLNIIDNSLILLNNRLDFSYVSNSVFEGSFNNLKNQIDNSFASITITSLNTSSISVETINTKHHSQRFNNISWNQFGLDLSSGLSLSNNNNKTAISNDGKVVAYSLNDNLSIQELEQVVTTWTPSLTAPTWSTLSQFHWSAVSWSPYLRLFTSLSSGTDGATQSRSMWSTDAQFWNPSEGVDYNNTLFTSICWSQEKYMFVAVGNSGDRRLAYSYNGKKWFQWYNQAIIPLPLNSWSSICWSKELGIFVAVADDGGTNRVATGGATGGATGIEDWSSYVPVSENNRWTSVCWSAELRRFVAVAREGTNRVMTSITGYSWSLVSVSTPSTWSSVCWSKELELFVAVATSGSLNVMTSNNGTNWNAISSGIDSSWNSVCWSGELGVFVAVAGNGINRVMSSINGINWRAGIAAQANNWRSICWSPELGLFVAVSTNGTNRVMTSSLTTARAGSVYVYELSYNNWNRLGNNTIVGLSGDQLGYSLALSSNGRIVAASSLYKDASAGQVRIYELSNNSTWIQKGSNINGQRPGSESGYSISLAGSGNSIAIGAWKDNSNGTNAGAVRVYDFSASINDWRQKGQTINGVTGSFEGYSTALSLDGQTLASSSIASIASGGIVYSYNEYIIHRFDTSGTFIPKFNGPVEVLLVGGGGSGGRSIGGGGGGGGVIWIPVVNIIANTSYPVVVGSGGALGTNGESSSVFGATAAGGGSSGEWARGSGLAGGSGGGAAAEDPLNRGGDSSGNSLGMINGVNNIGTIYGNRGGHMTTARSDVPTRAAGGGGAGGQGLDTNTNIIGNVDNIIGNTGQTGAGSGGIGIVNSILGPSYYWGGGGGGGAHDNQLGGWGGLGGGGGGSGGNGGGAGGGSALNIGISGEFGAGNGGTNTGGGGGGGSLFSPGGRGGSGIVVIRYKKSDVKIFAWSGTTWEDKGFIRGPDISNSYFGISIKLSANGNTIVVGAPGAPGYTEYRITPIYEYNSSLMTWQNHRNNAISVYGRDLAVILDASQNAQANAIRNNTNAFIGGRRVANPISATGKTAADWEWVTGDAWSYENFANGEPNGTNEKAVHFWTTEGKWNDIPLENNYPAIYMYYKARSLNVGQAYVYGYQGGTTWTQLGQTIREISGGINFGSSVNISNDGTIISVGTNDISSNRGYVNVYKYVNNYWTQISNSLNGNVATFKAGLHALAGDGTTLIQSNNSYYSVYGINKLLALNSPVTTISGNLIVIGNMSVNSLDISGNHSYSSNGYSSKMFNSNLSSAIMKDYYSNVTSTKDLKVQIYGNGDIKNKNNSFSSLSDSRLKENIVTSGPKLEDLLKVRVVNYNLKGSNSTNYIGVLAQELEKLFPNLVTELEPSPKDVEEGRTIRYKAVNYSSFDSILIKALQEQNAMLKNITQNIEALEAALEAE